MEYELDALPWMSRAGGGKNCLPFTADAVQTSGCEAAAVPLQRPVPEHPAPVRPPAASAHALHIALRSIHTSQDSDPSVQLVLSVPKSTRGRPGAPLNPRADGGTTIPEHGLGQGKVADMMSRIVTMPPQFPCHFPFSIWSQ